MQLLTGSSCSKATELSFPSATVAISVNAYLHPQAFNYVDLGSGEMLV